MWHTDVSRLFTFAPPPIRINLLFVDSYDLSFVEDVTGKAHSLSQQHILPCTFAQTKCKFPSTTRILTLLLIMYRRITPNEQQHMARRLDAILA